MEQINLCWWLTFMSEEDFFVTAIYRLTRRWLLNPNLEAQLEHCKLVIMITACVALCCCSLAVISLWCWPPESWERLDELGFARAIDLPTALVWSSTGESWLWWSLYTISFVGPGVFCRIQALHMTDVWACNAPPCRLHAPPIKVGPWWVQIRCWWI